MAIQNLDAFREHPLLADNPGLVRVLKVFDGISSHPRPSYGEAAVRQHLIELAQGQGWEVAQDETGNIAIQVPASSGREEVMPIVFQGHMDMVTTPADRNSPRTAEIVDKGNEGEEKGLWMQTRNQEMTLGADNGVGVSLALGLMMKPEVEHGPVTILVTVDEETQMSGAKNLSSRLLPKRPAVMVNTDNEDGSHRICITCAGDANANAAFSIGDRESIPKDYELLDVALTGFPGGHSGVNIHEGRGNAVQSLVTLLTRLEEAAGDLKLVRIDAGTAKNAIPSSAKATIAVPNAQVSSLQDVLTGFVHDLKDGSKEIENPAMTGVLLPENARSVSATLVPTLSVETVAAFGAEFKARILDVIARVPQGPFANAELPDIGTLVTSSNNLGMVKTDPANGEVSLTSMVRAAEVDVLLSKFEEICQLFTQRGGRLTSEEDPMPGWLEDTSTPIFKAMVDAVREAAGRAELMGIHAGLECGPVKGHANAPLSTVSIGPLILEAHTPRERVKLSTVVDVEKAIRSILGKVVELGALAA